MRCAVSPLRSDTDRCDFINEGHGADGWTDVRQGSRSARPRCHMDDQGRQWGFCCNAAKIRMFSRRLARQNEKGNVQYNIKTEPAITRLGMVKQVADEPSRHLIARLAQPEKDCETLESFPFGPRLSALIPSSVSSNLRDLGLIVIPSQSTDQIWIHGQLPWPSPTSRAS
ncbi:hypothetical protein CONLIGDRAFT_354567 [Coniochaeta ligniaria NRRL 30616]|uniref:Uncharacterized protein n=1 Tax=Coniochaeta ligniaria NRRL 30616 TaxID=1408157 RepID=A0A1J7JJJ5_9PEZI|nr:hypothetical protein CONLIGDRAFT_354567 [Coniochaeta ligniaria NRRL 30616]